MVLNNFRVLDSYIMENGIQLTSDAPAITYYDTYIGLIGVDGNPQKFIYKTYSNNNSFVTASNYNASALRYLSAKIGSGTTEPTASDYNIESDETTNFVNFTFTSNTNVNNGKIQTVFTIGGVNNSDSSITISEFVIYKTIGGTASGFTLAPIAIIRELLPEPKTVAPGQGISITYEWERG